MSTNSKVTLRRLIYELSNWSDNHDMIDRFGYGDFLELYSDSKNSYPYFMVNCSNTTISQWYVKYTLEICAMDWVFDNKENQERVESDCQDLILDLENTIRISPRWQAFSKLNGDISDRKFIEKGGDKVTGWCGTFNLWVKKKSGYCDLEAIMPEYDFQTQTPIFPSCAPGTYQNSDGSFSEEIASGDLFVAPDVTITVNGTPNVLAANKDASYSSPGDPAGNEVNGDAKTDIVGGTTKNFEITYADLSPVVVSQISDNGVLFKGTVPKPTQSKDVYYNRAWLTFPVQYDTYDEKWRADNGGNAYNLAIPNLATLQCMDFTGGLKDRVKYVNFYGHNFRFVGINGGYYNPDDGLYYDIDGVLSDKATEFPPFSGLLYWVIDTLTGFMHPSTGYSNTSYTTNLTNSNSAVKDGYSDFFVFSKNELYQLADGQYNNNRHPSFRPPWDNTGTSWTCTPWQVAPTTNKIAAAGTYGGSAAQQGNAFTGYQEYYGRIHLTGFVTQP